MDHKAFLRVRKDVRSLRFITFAQFSLTAIPIRNESAKSNTAYSGSWID